MDYIEIEQVAGELGKSVSLHGLLEEEIEDIYELTQKVISAKASQAKQEATSLLVIQLENRLGYIDALQTTISDQVAHQRDVLDKFTDEELKSRREAKKGDYNENR